ncbi:Signal transduction histidine kinase regulating C4-dicarboxylate transport system [Chromobacterium violaceum]|nr:GGDEF domain-containing protein [Chromobacterium violaceum]OQS12204.1 GGDEF domain-containing protein [Chromobacterium violaceum]OQS28360.1 GGDEF domain-containing protein [Chromobacterium violaceum]SUX83803.1 Probable diguanylate cyclase YfiN [Chromobacterium violaceum]
MKADMKVRRLLDSIIIRLLALSLAIMIIGVLSRYYTLGSFLRQDLGQVVSEQQLALAGYVAHDIDDKINQRKALLSRLATALPPELLDNPDALRAWLKERYQYQPLFTIGLFVVRPDGRAIADYPVVPHRMQVNYGDRDYIQQSLAGQFYIGKAVTGRSSGVPVLPMSAPIRIGGEVPAVLVGVTAISAPGFLDLLQQSRIGDHRDSFLLVSPRDRQIIAASQSELTLQSTPAPGQNPLYDQAMAGYRGAAVAATPQGEEEVRAVVQVPSTGWFLVARLPGSEAFATVARVQNFTLRQALIAFLVFSVLACGGMYIVLRPLFRAARHADRMTRGELPLEPLPIRRKDEVGHLIAAFNRLLRKLEDKQTELAQMAHHDALTGLPNRSLLSDRLHVALAQAQRRDTRLALLFMDLDSFKLINDSLGHKAGDKVLWQAAQRLSGIVRQSDTLARIGGDEFVLLISDLDDKAEDVARTVANKCLEAFNVPFLVSGTACQLGISIGIAIGDGYSSADSLLQAADQAMYRVKKTGSSGSATICL